MRDKYVNKDALQIGLDASEQMFASGKTAMVILGNWGLAPIRSYNPDGNFGVFLLPTYDNPDENLMQVFTDDNWMLSAESKNSEAQMKFLETMTSQEGGKIWASAIQGISTVKDAKADEVDPMTADIQAYIDAGKGLNLTTSDFSGQYLDVWFKKIQEFPFEKNRDLDAWVASFDKEFDRVRQMQ